MRRTYMRPMDGWWHRDPFFLRYMAREATAVFVVIYAAILLVTVARLAQGEESFARWMAVLASPGAIALHSLLLVAFLYHTWSWFRIMPKTMPPIVVAGRRLAPWQITALGLAASAFASAAAIAILVALAP